MTTLAANQVRTIEAGEHNDIPVVATDIIYQGAAVGVVIASGHARPLTSVDKFAGFAQYKADNSSGAAADINVKVTKSGKIKLPITGAVITDFNQPVYAQDDDTFSFLKTSGVFIGFMTRFVSSGYGIVSFDAGVLLDPHAGMLGATLSATATLNEEDTGKVIFVDTDGFVITLGAAATVGVCVRIVNGMAYGGALVAISPNGADGIGGPELSSVDDKDLRNTKATANRGDYVDLEYGDPTGWMVKRMVGTWVKEG